MTMYSQHKIQQITYISRDFSLQPQPWPHIRIPIRIRIRTRETIRFVSISSKNKYVLQHSSSYQITCTLRSLVMWPCALPSIPTPFQEVSFVTSILTVTELPRVLWADRPCTWRWWNTGFQQFHLPFPVFPRCSTPSSWSSFHTTLETRVHANDYSMNHHWHVSSVSEFSIGYWRHRCFLWRLSHIAGPADTCRSLRAPRTYCTMYQPRDQGATRVFRGYSQEDEIP